MISVPIQALRGGDPGRHLEFHPRHAACQRIPAPRLSPGASGSTDTCFDASTTSGATVSTTTGSVTSTVSAGVGSDYRFYRFRPSTARSRSPARRPFRHPAPTPPAPVPTWRRHFCRRQQIGEFTRRRRHAGCLGFRGRQRPTEAPITGCSTSAGKQRHPRARHAFLHDCFISGRSRSQNLLDGFLGRLPATSTTAPARRSPAPRPVLPQEPATSPSSFAKPSLPPLPQPAMLCGRPTGYWRASCDTAAVRSPPSSSRSFSLAPFSCGFWLASQRRNGSGTSRITPPAPSGCHR